MTQIHELTLKKTSLSRPKKRIGRGGKRGSYSGRGIKGQRSRAGHRIRPAERDLIQRLPKLRGFKNRRFSAANFILNVSDLDRLGLEKISVSILKSKGLLKPSSSKKVKILGQGKISRSVTISPDVIVSQSAADKIISAGGTVPPVSLKKNQI